MSEYKIKSTPTQEQETVINIQRDTNKASIWTNDTTIYTKLDKLVEQEPGEWRNTEIHTINGEICSKKYECDKCLISFRSKKNTRILTDEQRKEIGERLRANKQ